jgi:adenylate cyclase
MHDDDEVILHFGALELRLAERRVLVDGQIVALGSRGFDLLCALVRKRDRVVSKDELLDDVWPGLVVEQNNLQVQISGLRRVLGASAIATVSGYGYRFTPAQSLPAPALTGVTSVTAVTAVTAVTISPPALIGLPPSSEVTPGVCAAPTVPVARVLVADDNRVNRLLMCRSLELMGHQVSSAANGHEALELLRRGQVDLLLLDLAMPELDGFGLLEARARDVALREVAVIVTSALAGVAPVARCIELGADDFLHKPVDPWLLKARVDSSLLRKQHQDRQNANLRRLAPAGLTGARQLDDATVLAAVLHRPQGLEQAPQPLVDVISHWCTLVVDAIEGHGGQVTQFTGEAVLGLFDQARAAWLAAQDMAEVLRLFNAERHAAGHAVLRSGVGLARGAVVVGTATTAQRACPACIGALVWRAQRLAAASAEGAHGALMDEAARDGAAPAATAVAFAGFAEFAAFAGFAGFAAFAAREHPAAYLVR